MQAATQMQSLEPRQAEPCVQQCPFLIREALDLIAAKWTVPIFLALHASPLPLRYAQLRRAIDPISPKELAKQLRQLEHGGLIERRVFATIPPRVEYSLSELGHTLYPSLEGLAHWAARYGDTVAAHRSAAHAGAHAEASRSAAS